MRFTIEQFLGSNITTIYKNLELAKVSRDAIKRSNSKANLFDTEALIIVISPPGIIAQIAEKRVVVSDQTGSTPDKIQLWSSAVGIHQAIPEPEVTAYGFNYDVGVNLENGADALPLLTGLFVPDAKEIERKLEVDSLAFVPRLLYVKDSVRYDLRFDAAQARKERIAVHLNAHFARKEFPSEETLKQQFISEFREIIRVLELL